MKKIKVLIFLDKYHPIFKRIPELLSREVDFKSAWVGYFNGWSLFQVFSKIFYYRLKGFKMIHYQWLEMYYLDQSFMKSSLFAFVLLMGTFLLRLTGVKTIWTCHNIYPHENMHPKLTKNVRKIFVKFCDYIMVMHSSMTLKIRHEFGYRGKFKFIRGGCYDGEFEGGRADARRSLGLSENAFVIISIGNIRKYKNLNILIKAFRTVAPDIKRDMRLMIAGKTSDKEVVEEIERLSEGVPGIHLFLSETSLALAKYVAASDLMVLSQSMDAVSANVHLAAAYGLPILTTQESGATAKLVLEFGLGEQCDLTVDSMARALEHIYEKRETLIKYVNNARKFITEDTWEKSAQRHMEVYKQF